MKFLKVFSCNLILNIATALFIDEYMSLPKFDILYPPHYNIHFVLNVTYNLFYGEYNVSIYIPYKTQNIYVYTENLSITRIRVTNDTQIFKKNEREEFAHIPNKIIYNNKTYITTISFPYNLSLGFYTLNMEFTGFLAENGGFRNFMNQQNGIVLAATHYYKFATRRLFPLLKDTTYASYNISIKHHRNYTALSNMPVQEIKMDKNDMKWTRFKTTPLMPIYFITAVVVQLHLTLKYKIPVLYMIIQSQNTRLLCRKGILDDIMFAYTVVKDIARFLEINLPYTKKTSKTNHVMIPKLFDAEEITLGLVLYREEDIIINPNTDAKIRKIEIARIVGYKVMQEWLYNVIDPYEWEPWLIKGFATFLGVYAADKKFPNLRIQHLFTVQTQHEFLHWSTKDTWPLTIKSEFNNSFTIPRDIKTSIMFHTLQTSLGEVFWNGIEIYFNSCHTTSNDFWNIMRAVMHKSFFKMEYNLKDKITQWTQLNHYPVINVERNYENYLNISVDDFNADIGVLNITTKPSLKNILIEVWLMPHTSYQSQITIDFRGKKDSVLVNSHSEVYRVNYDTDNWNGLSYYLNTKFFGYIHVLDRAKIIDDTFHFLMTGRLNSTIFSGILRYIGQDTDYIAWYPMFKNFEYMSGLFALPESAPIKIEIRKSLNKVLWKIHYPDFKNRIDQEDIFTNFLRQEAARWLCALSDNFCYSLANDELKVYLLDYHKSPPFNKNRIWTGWKEWTFCNGLAKANNDTWMQVFDMHLKGSDNRIPKFLACSKNSSIILQYMHLTSNMTTSVDHIISFCSIVARHGNNIEIFDVMLHNLEKIKPKEISIITALIMIINHLYFKSQINEIKTYMEIYFKDDPKYVINYEYHKNNNKVIKSLRIEENMENIIMYVNRKLELRRHQIKIQLYEYRYLMQDFDNIFKEYLTD